MRDVGLSLHSACGLLGRSVAGPRGVVGFFILAVFREFLGALGFWVSRFYGFIWGVVGNDRSVSIRFFTNSPTGLFSFVFSTSVMSNSF